MYRHTVYKFCVLHRLLFPRKEGVCLLYNHVVQHLIIIASEFETIEHINLDDFLFIIRNIYWIFHEEISFVRLDMIEICASI